MANEPTLADYRKMLIRAYGDAETALAAYRGFRDYRRERGMQAPPIEFLKEFVLAVPNARLRTPSSADVNQ